MIIDEIVNVQVVPGAYGSKITLKVSFSLVEKVLNVFLLDSLCRLLHHDLLRSFILTKNSMIDADDAQNYKTINKDFWYCLETGKCYHFQNNGNIGIGVDRSNVDYSFSKNKFGNLLTSIFLGKKTATTASAVTSAIQTETSTIAKPPRKP